MFIAGKHMRSNPSSVFNDNSTPDRIQFRSYLTYNDYYRERRNNLIDRDIYTITQQNELSIPLRVKNITVTTGAYFNLDRRSISYDVTDFENLRMESVSNEYGMSLSIPLWREVLSLSGSAGEKRYESESYYPYSLGAFVKFGWFLQFGYTIYKDYMSWKFDFIYEDSPLEFEWMEEERIHEIRFRIMFTEELGIDALILENSVNRPYDLNKMETIYIPVGDHETGEYKASYSLSGRVGLGFTYSVRNLDYSGRFYEQKISFGKITQFSQFYESFSPEITVRKDRSEFLANFSWGKGLLKGRGHIETWPFSDTWTDLLGLRYYSNSQAGYRFKRVGLGYHYAISGFDAGGRVVFEHLATQGDLRTWEPEFLVFGQKNLKKYLLDISEQDGFYLRLNLSKSIQKFRISYGFSQYIPLRSEYRPGEDTETTGGSSADRSVYGGGRHNLQLTIDF